MPSGLSWNHQAGPELQARIMAGERRQLARIGALVEGEEDDRQPGLVAEPVEQRLQRLDVVGAGRDVGALVAAIGARTASDCGCGTRRDGSASPCRRRALIAAISVSIWARNSSASAGVQPPPSDPGEQRLGFGRRRGRRCARSDGRDRSRSRRRRGNRRGACGGRRDSRASSWTSSPVSSAKRASAAANSSCSAIDHRVGAIGGDDPAAASPSARIAAWCADRSSCGAFGGGEQLDPEAVEQGARAEGRRRQRRADRSK